MLDITLSDYLNRKNYTIEVETKFTPAFVKHIIDLYKPYGESDGQLSSNYTPNRIAFCFASQRFKHGFFTIKCCGQIVLTFGVDDFHGWGVVARYLRHCNNSFLVPIAAGVALPHAIDVLQIEGLCSTHNVNDQAKDLVGAIKRKYEKYTDDTTTIYGTAARLLAQTRKLKYNVLYRNAEQCVYVYSGQQDPPFNRV